MQRFLKLLSLLLLGLWLGAAIFFGAAVAPNLFNVLRGADLPNANALAGTIVTRLLAIINRGGFEIATLLLVMSFFATRGVKPLRRFLEMISLAIMAIMTALGHWIIAARMLALRTAMQLPIDQIAPSDPRRIEFDNLHRYSVTMMGIAIVAALAGFAIIAMRPRPATLSD